MDGLSRILAIASIPLLVITLFLTYKFLTIANVKTNEQYLDKPLPKISRDNEQIKIYPAAEENTEDNADQIIYDFITNDDINYDPKNAKKQIDPYTAIPDKKDYLEAAAKIKADEEEKPEIKAPQNQQLDLPAITINDTKLISKKAIISQEQNHRVQIGAFRNKNNALMKWQQLTSKYPSLFKETSYKIRQNNNHKYGNLYKLNAGPFSSETNARKFCKKLRRNNISCFYTYN